MSYFKIINQIDISHDGPVASEQLIHLAQGSMDGACGPYSLMMALMVCGLMDRNELVSLGRVDGRTRAGKLVSMLQKYEAFFRNGTELPQLVDLLNKSYSKKLSVIPCDTTGVAVRTFVKEHLDADHPVILGLDYNNNGGHWVVAIGYEYDQSEKIDSQEESKKELSRFLLLDPDAQAPIVSAWNGIVDTCGTGGRFPYVWWGKDYKINFSGALALCPLKKVSHV